MRCLSRFQLGRTAKLYLISHILRLLPCSSQGLLVLLSAKHRHFKVNRLSWNLFLDTKSPVSPGPYFVGPLDTCRDLNNWTVWHSPTSCAKGGSLEVTWYTAEVAPCSAKSSSHGLTFPRWILQLHLSDVQKSPKNPDHSWNKMDDMKSHPQKRFVRVILFVGYSWILRDPSNFHRNFIISQFFWMQKTSPLQSSIVF